MNHCLSLRGVWHVALRATQAKHCYFARDKGNLRRCNLCQLAVLARSRGIRTHVYDDMLFLNQTLRPLGHLPVAVVAVVAVVVVVVVYGPTSEISSLFVLDVAVALAEHPLQSINLARNTPICQEATNNEAEQQEPAV